MRWLILATIMLGGCSTKYVPVAVNVAPPREPPECSAPIVVVKPLAKFTPMKTDGTPWTVREVHAVWVAHEIEVQAATRKNISNHKVCARFRASLKSNGEG
jgi:hypothetical protein